MKRFYVYILTNPSRRLYVGVTNNLARRLSEHQEGVGSEFTSKYKLTQLVHVEDFPNARSAIEREKEIKGWRREKKVALIEEGNPHWEEIHFVP